MSMLATPCEDSRIINYSARCPTGCLAPKSSSDGCTGNRVIHNLCAGYTTTFFLPLDVPPISASRGVIDINKSSSQPTLWAAMSGGGKPERRTTQQIGGRQAITLRSMERELLEVSCRVTIRVRAKANHQELDSRERLGKSLPALPCP